MLTKAELEEFKWTVDEYIKLGMSGDPAWHKQLENVSARVHLNRLEALEIQLQEQVERIYRGREPATREFLAKLYKDNYYHNVFDVEQGVGIGLSFTRLDQKRLDQVVQMPWTTDNRTFSDRIWTSKQTLLNSLNRNLTQMIARGEAPDRTIEVIANEFKKDKNTVGRLVMTESAAFSAKARADAYADLGVERFKIVATLDPKTSEICQDMDGKHFAEKDREIGVTCPPFHPWCRSTDVPYFDDEFTTESLRVARDPETGQVYEVPASMTYEEWEKSQADKMNRVSRREKNVGEFSSLPEPMQKRHVLKVSKDVGIDVSGLTFKIQRSSHLLALPHCGIANGKQIGRIDLLPSAFKSREELIRTIYHEKIHVEQYRKYGVKYVQENRGRFEKEAYEAEEAFIRKLKKEGKLK